MALQSQESCFPCEGLQWTELYHRNGFSLQAMKQTFLLKTIRELIVINDFQCMQWRTHYKMSSQKQTEIKSAVSVFCCDFRLHWSVQTQDPNHAVHTIETKAQSTVIPILRWGQSHPGLLTRTAWVVTISKASQSSIHRIGLFRHLPHLI